VTIWSQGPHYVIEGKILVRIGFQRHGPHLLQELPETRIPRDVSPQDDGVDQHAKQPFCFPPAPVSNPGAHAYVILLRVAME
jgi:hypothetical protein